jgi:hypothetical protein
MKTYNKLCLTTVFFLEQKLENTQHVFQNFDCRNDNEMKAIIKYREKGLKINLCVN